jgi:hypothetical protein
MKLSINVAHAIGDIVYLRVVQERSAGIVTGYAIRPDSTVLYYVSWDDGCERMHYDLELCKEYCPTADIE